MIKIVIGIFGIVLLLAGWFISNKGKEAFIFRPESYSTKEMKQLEHFFQKHGKIYIFFGVLSFMSMIANNKIVYAVFLIFISLYTAIFSLQLSKRVR